MFFGWQKDQTGTENAPSSFEQTAQDIGRATEQIDEVLGRTSKEARTGTRTRKSKVSLSTPK